MINDALPRLPAEDADDTLQEPLFSDEEEASVVTRPATAKEKLRSIKAFRGQEGQNRLKALALQMQRTIHQANEAKGELKERVAMNRNLYKGRNVMPAKLPWPGAQSFHIPIAGPKLTQRKANVVGTITSQRPYFRLRKIGSPERIEPVEQTLQFFFDIIGWDSIFDAALDLAMYANMPVWRMTFQKYSDGYHGATHTGPFAGIVFDIIDPDFYFIYPTGAAGIPGARVVGHTFDIRKAEVIQKIKAGEFLNPTFGQIPDKDLTPKNIPGIDQSVASSIDGEGDVVPLQDASVPPMDTGDENMVLCDMIWRDDLDDDGDEELYRVIFREQNPTIFLIEPYTLPFHNYVAMPIQKDWGRHYAEGSPMQDMQGLQLLLNSLVNELIWGTQMAARPPIITENWSLSDSLASYSPGEYRNVRSLGKAVPVPVQFNPAGMEFLTDLIKGVADGASKTSDALTGAPPNARESTATEQNIRYQAFQIGSMDDITAIAPALRQIVLVMIELLKQNFAAWYPVYQEAVEIQNKQDLYQPFTIELAGKSPEDAPQMQSEQAQMLLQIAQAFPQSGLPVLEFIKSIVNSTSLPNKEDILRDIEQVQAAQEGPGPMMSQQDLINMIAQGGGISGYNNTLSHIGSLLQLAGMGGGNEIPQGQGGGGEGQVPQTLAA